MAERGLQLRAVLDDQYTTILVVFVIIGLLGGWVSYTTYTVGATTEQRTETVWETTGEFSHEAVVETNSSVFTAGSRLTDRPLYFTRVSPRLTGTFQTVYGGAESGNLSRRVSVTLVVRAVDRQQDDEETVYWQTNRSLNETTATGVEPQEPVSVSFTENITRIANRTDRIQQELGATVGETELLIRATVDSRGTVGGRQVTETNNYTLAVELNEETYEVGDPSPTTEQYERTRTETVEPTAGPAREVGGPASVLVSLAGLGGLVVGRRLDWIGLSAAEEDRLSYQAAREEYDDWISPVSLPEAAFDLPRANADSLTALVDIAIDTNNSVIEDPGEERFYLRHEGYLYSYRPPTAEAEAKDESDEGGDDSTPEADTDTDEDSNTPDD